MPNYDIINDLYGYICDDVFKATTQQALLAWLGVKWIAAIHTGI